MEMVVAERTAAMAKELLMLAAQTDDPRKCLAVIAESFHGMAHLIAAEAARLEEEIHDA